MDKFFLVSIHINLHVTILSLIWILTKMSQTEKKELELSSRLSKNGKSLIITKKNKYKTSSFHSIF